MKEALGVGVQELRRAVDGGTWRYHPFIGWPGVETDSMAHNTNFPLFYINIVFK